MARIPVGHARHDEAVTQRDMRLSIFLLCLCGALAAALWCAIFVEVGFRNMTSGPEPLPLCFVDAAPLVAFPWVSAAVAATGTVWTIHRKHTGDSGKWIALGTLMTVVAVGLIAAVVPLADTTSLCAG